MSATPETIAAAREWVADCVWIEDPEDIEEMTDAQILAGVERHYDGGLAQFIADAEPRPILRP